MSTDVIPVLAGLGRMNEIKVEIIRLVPVLTMRELANHDPIELVLRRQKPGVAFTQYELQPFFFAQVKGKAIVFQGSCESDLEKLEVEGEAKRLFKDVAVEFCEDGMPILKGKVEIPNKDQVTLPFPGKKQQ
jgi:hypothetical protein